MILLSDGGQPLGRTHLSGMLPDFLVLESTPSDPTAGDRLRRGVRAFLSDPYELWHVPLDPAVILGFPNHREPDEEVFGIEIPRHMGYVAAQVVKMSELSVRMLSAANSIT